jgi:hypothetical protein
MHNIRRGKSMARRPLRDISSGLKSPFQSGLEAELRYNHSQSAEQRAP